MLKEYIPQTEGKDFPHLDGEDKDVGYYLTPGRMTITHQ